MSLVPLDIPAGFFKRGTKYNAKGRWYDGNLVRFVGTSVKPVGGWVYQSDSTTKNPLALTGTPRGALGWEVAGGRNWQAYGTAGATTKLYAFSLGALYDITPVSLAASNADSEWGTGSGNTYYGSGLYGVGTYGSGQPAGVLTEADVWHLDNFGNYLVATQVPVNDSMYSFDPATPGTPAAVIANAPTDVRGLVVTPERFLVALGAGGDVRKVQWADRESLTTWTPSSSNEAGSYTLEGRGRIIAGRRGRLETLIWTDSDLYSMQYIGLPYVYSFQKKGTACGLVAPQAVADMNGTHVWMGMRGFFIYDGYVRSLPCDVEDIFDDINRDQRVKIVVWINHEFNEVTWFYPSSASTENDRYVTWNYKDMWWVTGKMERTCAISSTSTNLKPVLLDASGKVFLHESGWDHTIEQAANYTPYIESGPIEIGSGDFAHHVLKIVPDETNLGDVEASLYTSLFPAEAEETTGPFTTLAETDARVFGRWSRLLLTEVNAGEWRVGTFRLDVRRGSKR